MNTDEKIWAKTLLSSYSYLETICGAIDKTVLNYGINSAINRDAEYVANKIISLTERKKILINTKILIDNVLQRIDNKYAKILVLKYIDKIKSETASKLLDMSMRTYFRKTSLAVDNFASELKKFGYNTVKLNELFRNESWILEIYNAYVQKHIKDSEFENLNFLGLALSMLRKKTAGVF